MKKFVLLFVFSLLSATTVFGGFKSSLKSSFNKAESFIDRLDEEKIDEYLDKAKNVVLDAFDKSEPFVHNLDIEKIETHFHKVQDLTITTLEKAKRDIYRFNFSNVESIADKAEDITIDSLDNAKELVAHLNLTAIKISLENAEDNVDYFLKKYSSVVERLNQITAAPNTLPINIKTVLTPEDLNMTDAEYIEMTNHYNSFIISSVYINVFRDIETHVNNTESIEKISETIKQLHNFMKI